MIDASTKEALAELCRVAVVLGMDGTTTEAAAARGSLESTLRLLPRGGHRAELRGYLESAAEKLEGGARRLRAGITLLADDSEPVRPLDEGGISA